VNIPASALRDMLVMNNRGALACCFNQIRSCREWLILNCDQGCGFFRDFPSFRSHSGDDVACIAALIDHDDRLIFDTRAEAGIQICQIFARHDRVNAGKRGGVARIDANQLGMRVRAAKRFRVDLPGKLQIANVAKAAADFGADADSFNAGPDEAHSMHLCF
jgi:hypothetical protein